MPADPVRSVRQAGARATNSSAYCVQKSFQLQTAEGSRAGYSRSSFKHWTAGDNPTNGCNTRKEVLIAEAVTAPEAGPRCAITGGTWFSYYDEVTVDGARGLFSTLILLSPTKRNGPPKKPTGRHARSS
jgi:hypothetical protein